MTYFSKKTIEYKLRTTRADRKALLNRLDKGKNMYNLALSECRKQLDKLRADKEYQELQWNVLTTVGVVQGISHKHCSVLHRADEYSYLSKIGVPLGFEKPSFSAHEVS